MPEVPMKRLLILLLLPLMAYAAPFDVEVTVIAPTTGDPVDRYVLFLDGQEVGEVPEGLTTFPGLLTDEGTYIFRLDAINAAGTTSSDPVTVDVTEINAPGKPSIQIRIECDPCLITVN